ncbi:MAG: hypothetical protein PVH52_04695 [bacterium]
MSIALIPFVLAASVASLDALVLCTAEGHGTAVEVAHHVKTRCASDYSSGPGDSNCCRPSSGQLDRIGHEHGACYDIPLSLNLGDVHGWRPIVALNTESFLIEDVEPVSSEPAVPRPGRCSSLQHLESVVLLI